MPLCSCLRAFAHAVPFIRALHSSLSRSQLRDHLFGRHFLSILAEIFSPPPRAHFISSRAFKLIPLSCFFFFFNICLPSRECWVPSGRVTTCDSVITASPSALMGPGIQSVLNKCSPAERMDDLKPHYLAHAHRIGGNVGTSLLSRYSHVPQPLRVW